MLTAAGPDFEPERDLPGHRGFRDPLARPPRASSTSTTRTARASQVTDRPRGAARPGRPARRVARSRRACSWRPSRGGARRIGARVRGGRGGRRARRAGCARATARAGSRVRWADPRADLAGVHLLFLVAARPPRRTDIRRAGLLRFVPLLIALTRGWQGLTLLTREAAHDVTALPRPEVDPTGSGDVSRPRVLAALPGDFPGDPLEAAAFGACAASCVARGVARPPRWRPR